MNFCQIYFTLHTLQVDDNRKFSTESRRFELLQLLMFITELQFHETVTP